MQSLIKWGQSIENLSSSCKQHIFAFWTQNGTCISITSMENIRIEYPILWLFWKSTLRLRQPVFVYTLTWRYFLETCIKRSLIVTYHVYFVYFFSFKQNKYAEWPMKDKVKVNLFLACLINFHNKLSEVSMTILTK